MQKAGENFRLQTRRNLISGELSAGTSKIRLRFPDRERLKGRNEIRAVFNSPQNQRKEFSCSGMRLMMLKNKLSYNRIAFTFARKFGSAVERNRSRRLSREAYRQIRHLVERGWDLVLLVYPSAVNKLSLRITQLKELLNRARLISEEQ